MSRCQSCGALIRWAKTAANRRPIPLDAEENPDGNIWLSAGGLAYVASKNAPQPILGPRYISHFATCPNAVAHRKATP